MNAAFYPLKILLKNISITMNDPMYWEIYPINTTMFIHSIDSEEYSGSKFITL